MTAWGVSDICIVAEQCMWVKQALAFAKSMLQQKWHIVCCAACTGWPGVKDLAEGDVVLPVVYLHCRCQGTEICTPLLCRRWGLV
jgi:hypothetical protein